MILIDIDDLSIPHLHRKYIYIAIYSLYMNNISYKYIIKKLILKFFKWKLNIIPNNLKLIIIETFPIYEMSILSGNIIKLTECDVVVIVECIWRTLYNIVFMQGTL